MQCANSVMQRQFLEIVNSMLLIVINRPQRDGGEASYIMFHVYDSTSVEWATIILNLFVMINIYFFLVKHILLWTASTTLEKVI